MRDLDLTTAERLLARVDPDLRPAAVAPLSGGDNSAVFEVRAADGRSVVVKLYSDLLHWKLAKEVYVYGLLRHHATPAPVADVLGFDDSKTVVAQTVLVLSKLDGRNVYSLLERLDDVEQDAIDRRLGEILRALHAIRFDAFGYVRVDGVVDGHATNLDYMRFQFEKKLREFGELGGDAALRMRIEQHVREREELFAGCSRPVLCHDDCHYANVLVVRAGGAWRVSGLVDFENVVAGDPLLDLAKTSCYSPRSGDATLSALADGYGKLRDGWREAIDVYVVYHLLELWAWLAAVGPRDSLPAIADDLRELVAPRRPRRRT